MADPFSDALNTVARRNGNPLPRLQVIDASSASKPDNYRISPISPAAGYDISIWEDWSGKGSHVEFKSDEAVPLVQGRFLGHGAMGGVYETHCKGVALAWKRRFCRKKIGDAERKEIEILKKLSHRHIIRLVGTYTHSQFLGLLLYPVAVCDLATFFEDFETLDSGQSLDLVQEERFQNLGLPHTTENAVPRCSFLYATIGCLANAIEYLHSQQIRHKDLKPSNILLSRNRVWLTDFGSATDFSMLSQSSTENGERGTPKYFAPEVAKFRANGRAADIFSLGCIFLEIVTLYLKGTLKGLKALRPSMDTSFQANIHRARDWFNLLQTVSPRYRHLLLEIEQMLALDPELRPTATILHKRLVHIDHFRQPDQKTSLFGRCCSVNLVWPDDFELAVNEKVSGLKESTESEIGKYKAKISDLESELAVKEELKMTDIYEHDQELNFEKEKNRKLEQLRVTRENEITKLMSFIQANALEAQLELPEARRRVPNNMRSGEFQAQHYPTRQNGDSNVVHRSTFSPAPSSSLTSPAPLKSQDTLPESEYDAYHWRRLAGHSDAARPSTSSTVPPSSYKKPVPLEPQDTHPYARLRPRKLSYYSNTGSTLPQASSTVPSSPYTSPAPPESQDTLPENGAYTSRSAISAFDVGILQGWVAHYDAMSEKHFYHNERTGETTWDNPLETK